jgi:hypothetical protein
MKIGRLVVYSIVGIGFLGLFWWGYTGGRQIGGTTHSAGQPTPEQVVRGAYSSYDYVVTMDVGQRMRLAVFNPALVGSDDVVLGALHELINSVYHDSSFDGALPVVETRDEKNYITMSAKGKKVYFQLFKNDKGEVGSVNFWQE